MTEKKDHLRDDKTPRKDQSQPDGGPRKPDGSTDPKHIDDQTKYEG